VSQHPINFEEGQAYERAMGSWSQLVGQEFLEWLSPASGHRWLDVGCGNGAFTELLIRHCAPAEIQAIDLSHSQLEFARKRQGAQNATFLHGDAMDLPFGDSRFDATAMALVIFFVADPARSVAEMARVTCAGGLVAAYVWDSLNDGSPLAPIAAELREQGITMARPPRSDIAGTAALRELWVAAGLEAVETRSILVRHIFADFEDFWHSTVSNTSVRSIISAMPADEVDRLKRRMRARAVTDHTGRVTYQACANAIRGQVSMASR
jgi:SAM-dependent methyltransferase